MTDHKKANVTLRRKLREWRRLAKAQARLLADYKEGVAKGPNCNYVNLSFLAISEAALATTALRELGETDRTVRLWGKND